MEGGSRDDEVDTQPDEVHQLIRRTWKGVRR